MRPADPRDALASYNDAKTLRSPYEEDWRMCAAYCLPRHYAQWRQDGAPTQNMNSVLRRVVYDNTGIRSVPKWVSILQRLATPDGHRWHKVGASNTDLMKVYSVRKFFDDLGDLLFKYRYNANALFVQAQTEAYTSIGVYGTGPKAIMWRRDGKGFGYKAWSLRDIFILVDDEGRVTSVFRRMHMTARQFKMKFPGVQPPTSIAAELAKTNPSETNYFEIVHCVHERSDYEEKSITIRRMPYTSYYVATKDCTYVGDEEGFLNLPYVLPRVYTEPGDLYGYSPAQQALPALGGVSAMKKTLIKTGQKALDPPLLVNDDGVISGKVDQRPGAMVMGGINRQGQPMVKEMVPQSRFDVANEMLQDERGDIRDAFMVTLFEILADAPEMTATQVMERVAEKASLIAPTMGRLQSEDLGPMVEREVALLMEKGLLPQMPGELIEAKGEYEIEYSSPLAKSLRAEDAAGYMRLIETAISVASATGDSSPLDHFDLDVALPEMADIQNVPTAWMASPDKVKAKRDARQQQQEVQTAVDAAPAAASVVASAMKTQQAKGVA